MTTQKSKKEIILEIAGKYTSATRSVRPTNTIACLYFGPNGGKCAFAACCNNEPPTRNALQNADNESAGVVASALLDEYGDSILLPEYQGHETLFWDEIQQLHDMSFYWDKNGLTEKGREAVAGLLLKWDEKSKIIA